MRNANDDGPWDGLRCRSFWPAFRGLTTGGAELRSLGRRILIHLQDALSLCIVIPLDFEPLSY